MDCSEEVRPWCPHGGGRSSPWFVMRIMEIRRGQGRGRGWFWNSCTPDCGSTAPPVYRPVWLRNGYGHGTSWNVSPGTGASRWPRSGMVYERLERWRWNRYSRGNRCGLEIREEVLWTTKANRSWLMNRWERFSVPLQDSLNAFTEDTRR